MEDDRRGSRWGHPRRGRESHRMDRQRCGRSRAPDGNGSRRPLHRPACRDATSPSPLCMTTVRSLAVVGAGTMGSGIAYVAVAAGIDVALHDADSATRANAASRIAALFASAISRGNSTPERKADALARLTTAEDIETAVSGADLIIEAVPEQLELKRAVFVQAERHAPSHAILASNTSSLSVSEIGSALKDPGRLLGMHFFNPVHAMRLVEIVRGQRTRDETVT